MTPHIHAECLIALANGEKEFEHFHTPSNEWHTCAYPPLFHEKGQYRIKPKETLRHFAWIPLNNAWEEVTNDDPALYAIVVTLHSKTSPIHPFSVSILENKPLDKHTHDEPL